ncbi:type II toxin-antitoxin system RelB/DinJ family antitoxin [Muribacter muris]|uniref:Type II toxin-antitoxin system RelB/DinJ family antitoxin n=1 Tax=Muribacter muris TaxID=67855 RepID=A0A4Y9JUN0_9PAST|nr:type II toxin-antitoxin system RelB/DinJ family antitoxin [Muribacter muris]MBF0786037.1 type II toxin-antitoxin system RelB/DinJ family antitoxin [Muribacter muris]MBF0826785.1 type II toxin-antitoxin system RelB/DinJ family antitoxin [Muribacter muris]TFV08166.1 type II toxin-antitoxin system RelB/DinJ family antitoxin [Muribacter muris]
MVSQTYVKANIEPRLKEQANLAVQKLGLSMSDVIRLVLMYIVEKGELPVPIKAYQQTIQKDIGK